MNKIRLIIEREYISRVKKKTFIIMTLLGPILMASLFVVPVLVANMDDEEQKTIVVFDETGKFDKALESSNISKFVFLSDKEEINKIKHNLPESEYFGILKIEGNEQDPDVELLSVKQPSIGVKMQIGKQLEKELERRNLEQRGLDASLFDSIRSNVDVNTITWKGENESEQSSTELVMAIGFIAAMIIYMFIFIYGAQVMRGVIEEKTNRIVEIMVSSVKPFQLMMGKIIGIALVAFTQFALWVLLTMGIMAVVQPMLDVEKTNTQQLTEQLGQGNDMPQMNDSKINEIFNIASTINWFEITISFIFYFFGGYLLYASLFAAVGAAVDNEADTQQFMLPITIPLILAIMMAQAIIQNPDGSVAFWFSIIPFTSPIIMLVRIAFGVPTWELILSMVLLVLTFIFTTWFAGKIYRTGILMYGKKITYGELWKWIRYKN